MGRGEGGGLACSLGLPWEVFCWCQDGSLHRGAKS